MYFFVIQVADNPFCFIPLSIYVILWKNCFSAYWKTDRKSNWDEKWVPRKSKQNCCNMCLHFFLNIFMYQRWKENWEDCFLFDLWDVKVMASLSTKWKASVVKGYKARRLLLPWIVSCCIVERLKIHVFWRRHLKIWNASLEN